MKETVERSWSDTCAKSGQPIICWVARLRLKIINDVVYYLTRQTVKETVRRLREIRTTDNLSVRRVEIEDNK